MCSNQTNPPEFDPAQEATTTPFETLDAFAEWLDTQLESLEEAHEGFETATSVRGFFGR